MLWWTMALALWLLLYVTPAFGGTCARNYYYDGLLDSCQPCSIRCNSPPLVCVAFCKPTVSSSDEAGDSGSVRVVLIVLLVLLGACFTLTLILQVIRRKTCSLVPRAKAQERDASESERGSETTEQSDDGTAGAEESRRRSQCNSSLPLPSTEEGNTALVTTKTVQTYNCRTQYMQNITLGVWRTEIV